MSNFRSFTYRLPNRNEPALERRDRGPLAPYEPHWGSANNPLVHPVSDSLRSIGVGAGIAGGMAVAGRATFRGKKGWDYYHSTMLGIEEYSPGRMLRTFQLSTILSPATTAAQLERFISPDAIRELATTVSGQEQLRHIERVIGKSLKDLGVLEEGFTFRGGRLYLGKTRQVILKHAQVFLNPMRAPSTFGLGYARSLAGKEFVPTELFKTPISTLRAGSPTAQAESILFGGGRNRFQSMSRGLSGYGTTLAERMNQLSRAPFELPPFKWIFTHVPGLNRIGFDVVPKSGLRTLGKLTGKLGLGAGLLYGAYSYLDYSARQNEALDKTPFAEGITAAAATLWTQTNIAVSTAAESLGLHDYREWQEETAPRSTSFGALLAFPMMGGLTGLGLGYAERIKKMGFLQARGLSVADASRRVMDRDSALKRMLYDQDFMQQLHYTQKGSKLTAHGVPRDLSRRMSGDQWRRMLAESGEVTVGEGVYRGAGLGQDLADDVLKTKGSWSGRASSKWAQMIASVKGTRLRKIASKFKGMGPSEVKALLGVGVGLGLILPFLPGALLPDQRPEELEAIYSGRKSIPIRKGRWWEFGRSAYEGENIQYFRPHWFPRMLARGRDKAIYGEKELSPLQKFYTQNFTYDLEKKHYFDRPYPISGTAFQDVPLIGPLLAATIGKFFKPPRLMHTDEWQQGSVDVETGDSSLEYAAMPKRYGYKEAPGELKEGSPISPYGLKGVIGEQAYRMTEMIGLPGFTMGSIKEKFTGEETLFAQESQLESAQRMYGAERAYWDLDVGGGVGSTELFRRLYPHRRREVPLYNPIENRMPEWLPGPGDRSPDFRHGDPYVKVKEGEIRLPGAGYAAFYPELEDVDPEDYPLIHKYKILADVAQYSTKFDEVKQEMKRRKRGDLLNEEELGIYEEIQAQIKARRKKKIFYPYKFKERAFNTESEAALSAWNQAKSDTPTKTEQVLGRYWEMLAHGGDTPLENLTPLSPYNKLVHVRTAVEEYEAFQVYGTKNAFWGNPLRDFIRPFGSSLQHALGIEGIPDTVKERRELEEYFDILKYVKHTGLQRQAVLEGDKALAEEHAGKRRETLFGVNPYTYNYASIFRSLPRRERDYFNEFVKADLNERERLREALPDNEQRLYEARWQLEDVANAKKATKKGLLTAKQTKDAQQMTEEMYDQKRTQGMPSDKKLWIEYLSTRLDGESYADWYRRVYLLTEELDGRPLPGPDWIGWHPMTDMNDIKLKVIQNRQENPIDYDIWSDQERLLARRPQVAEGADQLEGSMPIQQIRKNISDILSSHNLGGSSISISPTQGNSRINVEISQDRREDVAYIGKKYSLN